MNLLKIADFLGREFLGSSLNHSLELGWNEILISLDFISISNNFLSILKLLSGVLCSPWKRGMTEKIAISHFFADFEFFRIHDYP